MLVQNRRKEWGMIFSMEPIGYVRGGRAEATKDNWGSNRCTLELLPERFTPAALRCWV
jgi:tRNA (adenine37-N6)-methyltransferase